MNRTDPTSQTPPAHAQSGETPTGAAGAAADGTAAAVNGGPAPAAARAPGGVRPESATEQKPLPEFFVVGHPKCGTTALYEMLMHHPQIHLPQSKEPWFFATELLTRTPPRPTGTPRTLDEYRDWFDGARPGQRIGEASAMYLWSRVAAQNIASVRPDAKVIAIFREPAAFLRSLHLEWVQIYVETETDLRTALALEGERRLGRGVGRHSYWPQALLYSDYVRYVEQLERYRAVFPPEQMLVLIYDDFRADNEATLKRVLRFLEVDEDFALPQREANPTVKVRSRALHEVVHAVSVGHGPVSHAVKAALKSVTSRRLRRRVLYLTQKRLVFTRPEEPDHELMQELRRRYRPEVEALGEYLGRDLVSLWGYDRLD
jgi:Sulfotransferase domain